MINIFYRIVFLKNTIRYFFMWDKKLNKKALAHSSSARSIDVYNYVREYCDEESSLEVWLQFATSELLRKV